jgi:hypothetical protein
MLPVEGSSKRMDGFRQILAWLYRAPRDHDWGEGEEIWSDGDEMGSSLRDSMENLYKVRTFVGSTWKYNFGYSAFSPPKLKKGAEQCYFTFAMEDGKSKCPHIPHIPQAVAWELEEELSLQRRAWCEGKAGVNISTVK